METSKAKTKRTRIPGHVLINMSTLFTKTWTSPVAEGPLVKSAFRLTFTIPAPEREKGTRLVRRVPIPFRDKPTKWSMKWNPSPRCCCGHRAHNGHPRPHMSRAALPHEPPGSSQVRHIRRHHKRMEDRARGPVLFEYLNSVIFGECVSAPG